MQLNKRVKTEETKKRYIYQCGLIALVFLKRFFPLPIMHCTWRFYFVCLFFFPFSPIYHNFPPSLSFIVMLMSLHQRPNLENNSSTPNSPSTRFQGLSKSLPKSSHIPVRYGLSSNQENQERERKRAKEQEKSLFSFWGFWGMKIFNSKIFSSNIFAFSYHENEQCEIRIEESLLSSSSLS